MQDNLNLYELESFDVKTLIVKSESLKNNPLKDPFVRRNPVLLPKTPGIYKVVFYLSGFTGNGTKNFNFKSFEKNFPQELDLWTKSQEVSKMIYVFVDAWTTWGGSQFINSEGCGNYEDYIVKDLKKAFLESLPQGYSASSFAVMGGSSGGYGALHLSSKHPHLFSHCLAIAPDCDFEVSLKPEIYKAVYQLDEQLGVKSFYESLKNFVADTHKRSFHEIANALAMGACYSRLDSDGMPLLPVNFKGDLDLSLWSVWLEKDPLYFLKKRTESLKKLESIFLSVGKFDQFLLQFGARKIKGIFEEHGINHSYEEFRGNHFDIGTRRKAALSVL